MQFLKTSGNIHCHKKILHNTLLNNMWLHATLREGPGGGGTRGDPASLPNSPERARIATGAVEFIQRMGAISGLARGLAGRASLRSKSGSSASRLHNPLVAYFGAPGGSCCVTLMPPSSNLHAPTKLPLQAGRLRPWNWRPSSRPNSCGAARCAPI